ncbi:MAG: ChuX/HutX family heme-like substrate-binding protein [Bacteroidota bacterium]
MNHTLEQSADTIRSAWQELLEQEPNLRIREAAKRLELSEAQLLATTVGEDCVRLGGHWPEFLKRLPELGYVMSLTRNDGCILEHKGHFDQVSAFGKGDHWMATVIGPIETRVFFSSWHVAFAVHQEKNGRELTSFQIFDRAGDAITKIFLQKESNRDAYQAIVNEFKDEDQSAEQSVPGTETKTYNDEEVDRDSFLADWDNLKDTHDFFPMLRKHQVHRYHALELAVEKYTYQIDPEALEGMLKHASQTKLPIMIFAGNRGNLQIHQDTVRTIRMLERGHNGAERWLNVLDPKFNMHLRMNLVDTAWVVKKPTEDGIVTAVELFDVQRNLITQFFGLRKPGIPQRGDWADLVTTLPKI